MLRVINVPFKTVYGMFCFEGMKEVSNKIIKTFLSISVDIVTNFYFIS